MKNLVITAPDLTLTLPAGQAFVAEDARRTDRARAARARAGGVLAEGGSGARPGADLLRRRRAEDGVRRRVRARAAAGVRRAGRDRGARSRGRWTPATCGARRRCSTTYLPKSFQLDLNDLSAVAMVADAVVERLRRGDRDRPIRSAHLRPRQLRARRHLVLRPPPAPQHRGLSVGRRSSPRAAASSARTTSSITTSRTTRSKRRSRRIGCGSTAPRSCPSARGRRLSRR